MRMRVKLLVWGGLVLVWAGALVLGWGNVESGTADPLLTLGSARDLVPPAHPDIPDSTYYVTTEHLLVLVAVTAAAVLLPLAGGRLRIDRKSTRLNSSHVAISYAVRCLKNKNIST